MSQSEKVYSLKMKAYNSSEVMRKKERERVNTKIVKAVGLNDIIKLQRHWQHISITFGPYKFELIMSIEIKPQNPQRKNSKLCFQ